MVVHKGYHCAYEIHYHFVFPVKYRRALIQKYYYQQARRGQAGTHRYEIQERYGLEIEQMGADSEYIHWLCSAHPKYSPGQIVRLYKSVTARDLFKAIPQLKKAFGAASSGRTDTTSPPSASAATGPGLSPT